MLVSVIIPTYKRVASLQKAIESVFQQTYRDYEVIVVNDNPADQLDVERLKEQFSSLIIHHHAEARGGNAARNTGITQARGQILAFLDDDDTWLPEKLASHVSAHRQHPNAGLVFSNCLYVYDKSARKSHATSYQLQARAFDLMKDASFCPATTSMVTLKKECIQKCGLFDESLVSFQDWDFWFRISHHFEFVHVPAVLVHFRQHLEDRTSENETKRVKGLGQICSKWGNEIDTVRLKKTAMGNLYYKTSFNHLLKGEKKTALRKSFRLLKPDILSIQSCKSFLSILARSI